MTTPESRATRPLHARSDQGRLRAQQRYRLALHVRSHQGTVGIVVFQEGDQSRCHRDKLFRRNIDIVDLARRTGDVFSVAATRDKLVDKIAFLVGTRAALRDRVARFAHGGQIVDLSGRLALIDLAVGRFDEPIGIDTRMRCKRVDQADVRSLRRLDRADTPVVRRMHVAHLEAGALAREPARTQRREASFVRDLRERVRLIHELRQRRGVEKLAHRRHHRLGVDQILRHGVGDIRRPHPLAHGALHAHQAHAVLVFQKLADRAHAAVAQVVDVVDLAARIAQLQQHANDLDDILLAQDALGILDIVELQARVHLHTPDRAEVVAFDIEEDLAKQIFRRLRSRQLAGAHDTVDIGECLFAHARAVEGERVPKPRSALVVYVQDSELADLLLFDLLQEPGIDLVARLCDDEPCLLVDQVFRQEASDKPLRLPLELFCCPRLLFPRAQLLRQNARTCAREHLSAARLDEVAVQLAPLERCKRQREDIGTLLVVRDLDALVVDSQDLLAAHAVDLDSFERFAHLCPLAPQGYRACAIERREQRCRQHLPAPIDTRVQNVLGVELEVEPRATIGNHPRRVDDLVLHQCFALARAEEDPRRAVHLTDDHALRAVDDEGTFVGHQRQVAHIDDLLLDLAQAAGACCLVDVVDEQLQSHLQRCFEAEPALTAFLHIVLRLFQLEALETQLCLVRVVADRKDELEHLLQAEERSRALRGITVRVADKGFVRGFLNVQKIGNLRDFLDASEILADAFATRKTIYICNHDHLPPRTRGRGREDAKGRHAKKTTTLRTTLRTTPLAQT